MIKVGSTLTAVVLAVFLQLSGGQAMADTVATNPLNHDPQVREGFSRFYIMDYDGAISTFTAVQKAHPDDPIATDYLLYVQLFRELYRLDLLDTTFYANDGFLTGKHTVVEDSMTRDQIKALSDKAVDQANAILKSKPDQIDAIYARGWARSLEATYQAMVERSFSSGLHLALQARSDHNRVLQLNPNYVDAKLVVGTYEYVVGALPLAFKFLIGFAGIHGSKSDGMAMLQDAAARGVITSVEARTCMMLFLRREGKYLEAGKIAESLVAQYPRDFLFRLEVANLQKDAGQGLTAIASYRDVINLARKPGYFPTTHLELVYFGLADTLRGQKLYADAIAAYREAAFQQNTSPELKRRCLLAAGQVYDLIHDHDKAREQYQAVIDAGSDTVQADQARKYMRSPYEGR